MRKISTNDIARFDDRSDYFPSRTDLFFVRTLIVEVYQICMRFLYKLQILTLKILIERHILTHHFKCFIIVASNISSLCMNEINSDRS